MSEELELYVEMIGRALGKVADAVEGLSADELNWRPAAEETNSIYVLATHVMGNARGWVLGIAGEQAIERDRPAEFAARGDDGGALAQRVREMRGSLAEAIRGIDAASLGRVRASPQSLWGAGPAEPVTGRSALAHVIEHANEHLGQIELTRDLAKAGDGRAR